MNDETHTHRKATGHTRSRPTVPMSELSRAELCALVKLLVTHDEGARSIVPSTKNEQFYRSLWKKNYALLYPGPKRNEYGINFNSVRSVAGLRP